MLAPNSAKPAPAETGNGLQYVVVGERDKPKLRPSNGENQQLLAVAFDQYDARYRERVLGELRIVRAWFYYQVTLLDHVGGRVRDGLVTPTDAKDWLSDCYGPPRNKGAQQ